ncbi:MAG: SoxR reducing system RseC family protein [Coriobacteriia bacterium]|nr:SoxR reducing system RseC family protein [Coriobacteriia bacterium]
MHEHGRVITVHDGAVDVRMEVGAACGGCTSCARGANGEMIMRDVVDTLGVTVGDTVDVVIPDSIKSRAAVAIFLVPVVCMLLGYLAGYLLGRWAGIAPDVSGLVFALIGANLAVVGVRAAERKIASSTEFTPKVDAIIARGHGRP